MKRRYKTFNNIIVDGDPTYCGRVEQCLDRIAAIPDGLKLLNAIRTAAHPVTMKNTDSGNSCTPVAPDSKPKLLTAIERMAQVSFQMELTASLAKAKLGGVTLEHLARQLALGLSPATYKTARNVVRPRPKPMPGVAPGAVMMKVGLEIADKMQILTDLASGALPLVRLPAGWERDLPRLLRNFLSPGTGSGSSVAFNPVMTFHCEHDPAMHKRPPAIGLAHELIHAVHSARGVMMFVANENREILEEIITTGFPPYNFEEFSDNKLRSQWPAQLQLRENY